jgi:FkbM family methyltransferase
MRSFSQNFEDVRLARVFRDVSRGFYIDVGAAHPSVESVTKHFYDLGWKGVNIEPDAALFKDLCRARPRDTNLNVVCTARKGIYDLYETGLSEGWSTLSTSTSRLIEDRGVGMGARKVEGRTLSSICQRYAKADIDFLKIDTEGHEVSVLEGADFNRWRPHVVVVEATWPHTQRPSHEEWEPLLLQAGYAFAVFDGVNRFYVSDSHREWIARLAEPISFFDSWELDRYLSAIEERDERIRRLEDRIRRLGAGGDDAGAPAARTHLHWRVALRRLIRAVRSR